jgi:hypothetical protein
LNGVGVKTAGGNVMLGLADPWIAAVYILCIAAAALCVGWGLVNWNRKETDEPESEIRRWAEEEDRVEKEL